MRILKTITDGKVVGYTLWLSVRDTEMWAWGYHWPCSKTSRHRLRIGVDDNGLCDFTFDGKNGYISHDVQADELDAIVTDHLPDDCKHLWPMWSKDDE